MSANFENIREVIYSNSEMAILDFMADHNQSFRTFIRHQVAAFYVGRDFHMVVYINSDAEPFRFHQFTVHDYKNSKEALYRLIYALEAEVQEMRYPVLYRMAKDKVVHAVHAMVKPIR